MVSNHTVLHARAAYEDDGGSSRRRHLLRLWLSLDRADGTLPASPAPPPTHRAVD